MTGYGLGIDLGTTQTAAAIQVDGRVEVVRLGGRKPEIPSLVFVKPDGELLIGDAAERRGLIEPARLAREFKRRIGDPVPILAGGAPFSAHALTAKLLRYVLDTVTDAQGGPPGAVTVTYPANWGPYKREQLDQALRLADATGVRLRTEPEAAALQHATGRRIPLGATVAVYDLGGGTFDAAVLRRDADGFTVLGQPEGIEQLGGADFDEAVFEHVIALLGDLATGLDPGNAEVVTALARLRRDCIEAKEALSFDTEVMIPVALPGLHTRIRLNRSELESMIAPALQDTIASMQRALRSAGVGAADLDTILLAGGSSRIPLVRQLLTEAFGRPVATDPHPEHSIALGAAVATSAVLGAAPAAAGGGAAPPLPAPPWITPAPGGPGAATPGGQGGPGGPGGQPAAQPASGQPASGQPHPERSYSRPPQPGQPEGDPTDPAGAGRGPADRTQATPAQPGTDDSFAFPAGPTQPFPATPGPGPGPGFSPGPGPGFPPGPGSGAGFPPGSGPGSTTPPGTGSPAGSPPGTVPGPGFPPGPGSLAPGFTDQARPGTSPGVAYAPGVAGLPGPGNPPGPGHSPGGPAGPGGREFPGGADDGRGVYFPPRPPAAPVSPGAPDDPGGRPRNRFRLVMAGIAVASTIAAATAVVIILGKGDGGTPDPAAATTGPPSSPAVVSSAPVVPAVPADAMLIRIDRGGELPPERKTKVALLDPGTGERKTLVDTGGDTLPQWSSDRTRIALTRRVGDSNEIWLMNADGSGQRKVLGDVTGGRVSWSPDDKRLAFMRDTGGKAQMFEVTLDGGKVRQLTFSPAVKDDPFWSPDGKTILYWAETGKDNTTRRLFLLDVSDPAARPKEPGAQVSQDSDGAVNDPAFSPDGTTIAYTRVTGPGKSDIWVIGTDGTDAHELVAGPAREMDPTWSPDGTRIAFVRGELGTPTIVVIGADGTGERTLTRAGAREGHPGWS